MNKRVVFYNVSRITLIASALFFLPLIVSFLYRDGCWLSFLIPMLLMGSVGALGAFRRPQDTASYAREGFVTVTFMWLVFSVFGSLPFLLSHSIPHFVDAFFETVSGFTTTGSTILTDVEALPPSILFWRSLTHWVGGMGVLALAIALMPGDSTGQPDNTAVHILRAETPGPTFGKLVAKLRYNVRILYGIYTGLTLLEILFLFFGGMKIFDAVVTSFATAGTGGFGIRNASIAAYDSLYCEMVIGVFMLLFGVNFNIYYFILTGKLLKALKSEELRWYLGIVAVATFGIAVNILPIYKSTGSALRYAFFQVSSIITTTGFGTADFELWPMFSKAILVLLMFIGACVSSTGGGLKITRVLILVKTAWREIRHQLNPREVRVIRCDGATVDGTVANGVTAYFAIYILTLFFSAVLISFDSLDFTTTVTSVITCLNNIGPGLGAVVGPSGNFSSLSFFSKLVLCFDMLAGRLEIYPLLITLSPSVWKRNA